MLKIEDFGKASEPDEGRVIYRAVCDTGYGLSENNEIYVGLKLEAHIIEGHDPLKDQIDSIGSEGIIHFDKPLEEGKFYTPVVVNISRDWETGYIDDWEISIREIDFKET